MPTREQFLSDIRGDNVEQRFAAWRSAAEMDASILSELGKIAATASSPGVAKAAREAMQTLVNSVGKEPGPKRAEVVRELLALASGDAPVPLRGLALRLLSLIAGEDSVPAVAKWLTHADLGEEAVFCLERIPGAASLQAISSAYRNVNDSFKPRILAALGHRGAAEAVAICVEAMRSPNREIALAAAKAYGRIGKKSTAAVRWPDSTPLSEWQKIEHADSLLRFADAQREEGNNAEAMRLYKQALARPEPHLQSAAVIGIARIGTGEAAAAVFPLLQSKNRRVRITAEKAWNGMARSAAAKA
jgi:HEAT repeat protein